MRMQPWGVALLAGLALGCAHQKAAEPAPVVAAPAPAPAPVAQPAEPVKTPCSSDGQCGPAQLCIRGACVDIGPELAECQMFRVQFAFNSVDLDAPSRTAMDRMARCLRADQRLSVTIAGNADERGTEEYNLQLGSKRATTVEKYLLTLGSTPAQVKTISYGENMPLCSEQNEECWAKNRRASVKPDVKTEAKPAGSKAPAAKGR